MCGRYINSVISFYFYIIKKKHIIMKQEYYNKLAQLQSRVMNIVHEHSVLSAKQQGLAQSLRKAMADLDAAIEDIRKSDPPVVDVPPVSAPIPPVSAPETPVSAPIPPEPDSKTEEAPAVPPVSAPEPPKKKEKVFDLEKFIGENLMSKIGILVILIGVAIFGKYAIDNDLISPVARILLGSVFGLALIGSGFWLKKSVERLSAMLVSGGTAVLYLMTYFAYDFYGMMSTASAGGLMLAVSAFTIWCAVDYKSEVIAVYGQLCAYVVPLMVGNSGGSVLVFMGYVVIINLAITALDVIHKWNVSYVLSFLITWMVVISASRYLYGSETLDFVVFASLVGIHVANYYVTMAWLKTKDGGWLVSLDSIVLMISTFLLFVVCYRISGIFDGYSGRKLVFMIFSLMLNGLMAAWLYSRDSGDCKRLGDTALVCALLSAGFYFFDFCSVKTSVVILSLMMGMLYYLSFSQKSAIFRAVSFVKLGFLAIMDLFLVFGGGHTVESVLSALFLALVLGGMLRVNIKLSGEKGSGEQIVLIICTMAAVWIAGVLTASVIERNCLMAYAVVTLAVASVANWLFFNVVDLGDRVRMILGRLALLVQFSSVPVLIAIALHQDYMVMRYLSWIVLGVCMYHNHRRLLLERAFYVLMMITTVLAVTSFEVWDRIGGRLALSIWWGIFAVGCMYFGLVKKARGLRVYGIVLLSVTLIKLFFSDLSHFDTIAKVVVFIILGVIMLTGTYFYQKINKEEQKDESLEKKE